jgi:Mechanosensitive ion channel, conserved TM helix
MVYASITDQLEHGFSVFADWVPRLVGALVILIIGYLIAKLVARLIEAALGKVGFDRTVHQGTGGTWTERAVPRPGHVVGRLAFWLIMLGAISIAASVLGIDAVEAFVARIWAYMPNVIAALLIFLIAGAIAAAISRFAQRTLGETATGRIVSSVAPVLVMAVAVFMILDVLNIAGTIVTITYASLMGAVALGMALAFGLGGRGVAERMLEDAYQKGQRGREQMKRDMEHARAHRTDGRAETTITAPPTR